MDACIGSFSVSDSVLFPFAPASLCFSYRFLFPPLPSMVRRRAPGDEHGPQQRHPGATDVKCRSHCIWAPVRFGAVTSRAVTLRCSHVSSPLRCCYIFLHICGSLASRIRELDQMLLASHTHQRLEQSGSGYGFACAFS